MLPEDTPDLLVPDDTPDLLVPDDTPNLLVPDDTPDLLEPEDTPDLLVPDDVLALVDLLLQDGGEMPGVQAPLRIAVPQVSQHLKKCHQSNFKI